MFIVYISRYNASKPAARSVCSLKLRPYGAIQICLLLFLVPPGSEQTNKQTNVYYALAAFNKGWITQTYKVIQHIHNAMTVLKLLPVS